MCALRYGKLSSGLRIQMRAAARACAVLPHLRGIYQTPLAGRRNVHPDFPIQGGVGDVVSAGRHWLKTPYSRFLTCGCREWLILKYVPAHLALNQCKS